MESVLRSDSAMIGSGGSSNLADTSHSGIRHCREMT
jgi:hypothetical protein